MFWFYDLVTFLILYIIIYKINIYILNHHQHIFKVVFDIDLRINNYLLEFSTKEKHEILHSIVCLKIAILLLISPIIHIIIYFFLFFTSIVLLNRILLYITLFKLLKYIYLDQNRFTINDKINLIDLFQLIYIILNYRNIDTILPILFQLFDEIFQFQDIINHFENIYNKLFNRNIVDVSKKFLFIKNFLDNKKHVIEFFHIIFLLLIAIISLIISPMNSYFDGLFFYYSSLRIFQLKYNI